MMSRNSPVGGTEPTQDGIGFRRDKYNDPAPIPTTATRSRAVRPRQHPLIGMGAQIASDSGYVQNPFATLARRRRRGPVQTTTAGGVYMGGIG